MTYPLDITKTRIQLQNEIMVKTNKGDVVAPKKIGMLRTAMNIAKNEGK